MRRGIILLLLISAVLLNACKSVNDKQAKESTIKPAPAANQNTSIADKNIKEISPSFTNINEKVSLEFTLVLNKYFDLKNALANDNEGDAKAKGKELADALSKIDKALLTAEQKKVYEQEEDQLKENAEHIGKSKIEHQRMHFSMLSEGIYNIAKAFGGGRPLYVINCSKAENGEGAIWLSETAENKNPYMRDKTSDCFLIQQTIK